jgi:hypothetical protein
LWSSLAGAPNVPTTDQVLAEYTKLTGFNPADPSTDNGAVESDTLQSWKTSGLFGKNLLGFVTTVSDGINHDLVVKEK